MNILAIAYACEPDRGSEPGVGWNWVRLVSQQNNCNITVLTRANNRNIIEKYQKEHKDFNVKFLYYDLPDNVLKYKHGDKGIKVFFTLWQIGAVRFLKQKVDLTEYDWIWDFNFGSLNLPTFSYKLKKPYIIGPVSTKKSMPKAYIKELPVKSRIVYSIQQFMKEHLWTNIFGWKALKYADKILLCNELSKEFIPKRKKENCIVVFHNGIVQEDYPGYCEAEDKKDDKIKFIYAGRLIMTKNLKTAIMAFTLIKEKNKKFIFDIYGNGPCKTELIRLVEKLNLQNEIIFHDKVKQDELFKLYGEKDCFVFPSLLEISSTAVMEAMYCGLVPVCLDINCMEFVLNNSPAVVLPCVSPDEDAKSMADAIVKLYDEKVKSRKNDCHRFATEKYIWEAKKTEIGSIIEKLH